MFLCDPFHFYSTLQLFTPYNIHRLVFLREEHCVFCEVLYNVTYSLYIKYRSWNHVVGIENKLSARHSHVRIPAGLKFISFSPLQNAHTLSEDQQAFYTVTTGVGRKAAGA